MKRPIKRLAALDKPKKQKNSQSLIDKLENLQPQCRDERLSTPSILANRQLARIASPR